MNFARVQTSIVVLLVCGVSFTWGQGKDQVGDPLPDGAKRRVGTTRLHHLHGVQQLSFMADGQRLASIGDERVFSLWDLATGKEVRRLNLPGQTAVGEIPLAFERAGLQLELRRYFGGEAFYPTPAVLAADGAFLAINAGAHARIVDTRTGQLAGQVAFKDAKPAMLALGPAGKVLARYWMNDDREAEITITDVASAKQLHKLRVGNRNNRYQLSALTFSPDGKYLAGVVNNINIVLWDLTLGKRIRLYEGHDGLIGSISFAPNGKKLASAGTDGVRIWDLASDEEVAKFAMPDVEFYTAAFSPDGATLAATGKEHSIVLWDIATQTQRKQLQGHHANVVAFAFAADGKRLASGSTDGAIRLWDLAAGKEATPFQHMPRLHPLAYLKPGVILAQFEQTTTLHHVEEATGKIQSTFNGPTEPHVGIAVAPNGRFLALADTENAVVKLWDLPANKEWKKLEGHAAGRIVHMAFSGDGAWFASVATDKTLRIWSTATGKEVRSIELPFPQDERIQIVLRGPGFMQTRGGELNLPELTFSTDNRTVIYLGPDGAAYLFEIASGKERMRLTLNNRAASFLTVSPDGRWLVSAGDDTVRVWDTTTGKMVHGFVSSDGEIRALAFAPTGKLLAAGSINGTIYLYDVAAGKEKRCFVGHRGPVHRLVFAAVGNTLLSAARDGTMLVWDVNAPVSSSQPADEPDAKRLAELWLKLAGDAADAHQAAGELCRHPRAAVKFLQTQLRPAPLLDLPRVDALIAELDHPQFAVRTKAAGELTKLGDAVVPALRKVLDGKPTAEKSRRITQIVEKLTERQAEAASLRVVRSIEVLERIATPDAHALLEILAGGAPAAQITTTARDALERMQRSP